VTLQKAEDLSHEIFVQLFRSPGSFPRFCFPGRNLFSKGALVAEEIDAPIRQRTGGKKRLRDSFHAMMSSAKKSARSFSSR